MLLSDVGEKFLSGCWYHFFAQCCNTELPITHPFSWLCSPFQYRIRLIALETSRHQGIALALIFQHLFSTCHLCLVAAWSMLSYWTCCDCESLNGTRSLEFRDSHRSLLYFATTLGSLQWRCQASGCSIVSFSKWHTYCAGISNHSALWLLGMASPNSRYPMLHWSTSVIGRNMPSMGVLP